MQRHRPLAHTHLPICQFITWCKGTAQLLTDLANYCITRKLLWSVLVLFKPHRWLTCSPLYPRIWGDQVETLSWMKISSLLGARYLSRHLYTVSEVLRVPSVIRFDDTIPGARGIWRTHSSIAGIFITWKLKVFYLVRFQWRVSVSGVGVALGWPILLSCLAGCLMVALQCEVTRAVRAVSAPGALREHAVHRNAIQSYLPWVA